MITEDNLAQIDNVIELYNYGQRLLEENYDDAILCFERCLQLEPMHIDSLLQLFIDSIKKEDYDRSFELYEAIDKCNISDANYYLYLLNIITKVPQKYKIYVKGLMYKDVEIPNSDNKDENIEKQNYVRKLAFQKKFNAALSFLCNNIEEKTLFNTVNSMLLLKARNLETQNIDKELDLVKNKQYDRLINYILDEQSICKLNKLEEYLLKLARQYIFISDSLKVPKAKIYPTCNIFEAIDMNNFFTALRLCTEFNKEHNIIDDESTMY